MDVPLDRRRFLAGIVTAAAASRLGVGVAAADPSQVLGTVGKNVLKTAFDNTVKAIEARGATTALQAKQA